MKRNLSLVSTESEEREADEKSSKREETRERKVKRSLQHIREKQLLIITTERASSGDLDTTPKWPSLYLSLSLSSHTCTFSFFFPPPPFLAKCGTKTNEKKCNQNVRLDKDRQIERPKIERDKLFFQIQITKKRA
jgi:hypothetical protein